MGGWRGPHRGEVVVAVDGSAGCRRAVEFAVREAILRDADLVAVMSVGATVQSDRFSRGRVETGRIEAADHRLRQLMESVGTGSVNVTLVVTTVPAADALVDRSRFAELLVLGAGASSVSAAGSVSARCLNEAECPVVVVRPNRGGCARPDPARTRRQHAPHRPDLGPVHGGRSTLGPSVRGGRRSARR